MMHADFVQRFLWPVLWAELTVFLLPALAVMTGSPMLRNLFAGALGFRGWLLIMGFATFLMDKSRR